MQQKLPKLLLLLLLFVIIIVIGLILVTRQADKRIIDLKKVPVPTPANIKTETLKGKTVRPLENIGAYLEPGDKYAGYFTKENSFTFTGEVLKNYARVTDRNGNKLWVSINSRYETVNK